MSEFESSSSGSVVTTTRGFCTGIAVRRTAGLVGYGAFVSASAESAPYFSADWTRANVSSHGPLGAQYRVWGDGKQMMPGDRFDYFGLTGHSAAELRAMGYVVWLPPRPAGEFLGA